MNILKEAETREIGKSELFSFKTIVINRASSPIEQMPDLSQVSKYDCYRGVDIREGLNNLFPHWLFLDN